MAVVKAYASFDTTGVFAPFSFPLPKIGADDVHIKILYCGMCHSDVHVAKDEWGFTNFPAVPGHEIVGKVKAVGSSVTKFSTGDKVAVGCFVDSCRECSYCKTSDEQYCANGVTATYNSISRRDGTTTRGGYATDVVVSERFVFKLPESLDLAGAAPLLCAGVTLYSPMKYFDMLRPNLKIGVIGLGGLGHMAVKFAVAAGCEVTVISRTQSKEEVALKGLGAHHFINSSDTKKLAESAKSLDFILDTVNVARSLDSELTLLKTDGLIVLVGVPNAGDVVSFTPALMILNRRRIAGSLVCGTTITQEMLDWCAEKQILSDIELIKMDYVNDAVKRMIASDVKFRFVIDIEASNL